MQLQVASLEEKVKQHEDYNSILQEVEKWLLQMSSRLITPELMENSDLEVITQQLASHKVSLHNQQLSLVEQMVTVLCSSSKELLVF